MGAALNRQDLFERIVLSLSDVALGDVPWLASAGLIEEFLEASGSFLIFGDGAALDDVCIFFAQFCMGGERRDDLERMYFETYHAVDERLPRVRLLADSELVTTRSLFTEDELKTSAVYNEAMPLARTRDSLHVRLDGPKGSRIVWAVGDPVEGDGWSGEHVESIRLLLPYIRHFVRVQQTLADAGALESSLTGLLDNVRVGVLQLDRRGRVMAVNDRARDILRRADGLTDRDGLLQAALPAEDTRLQCLLAGALPIPGRVRAGGSMMVSRPHALQQLIVHVNPVNEARPNSYRASVGALVLVIEPASRNGIDEARVGAMLELTPVESEIAAMLARGRTIREIAAATGRSQRAIRWHLGHIFAKHGISRQVELVQLVTALCNIPESGP